MKSSSDDKAATAPGTRPKTRLKGGRRRDVYLDDDSEKRAVALGNGVLSEGIRKALAIALPEVPNAES